MISVPHEVCNKGETLAPTRCYITVRTLTLTCAIHRSAPSSTIVWPRVSTRLGLVSCHLTSTCCDHSSYYCTNYCLTVRYICHVRSTAGGTLHDMMNGAPNSECGYSRQYHITSVRDVARYTFVWKHKSKMDLGVHFVLKQTVIIRVYQLLSSFLHWGVVLALNECSF